jgi:hypothetical protein
MLKICQEHDPEMTPSKNSELIFFSKYIQTNYAPTEDGEMPVSAGQLTKIRDLPAMGESSGHTVLTILDDSQKRRELLT